MSSSVPTLGDFFLKGDFERSIATEVPRISEQKLAGVKDRKRSLRGVCNVEMGKYGKCVRFMLCKT